jgi:hypothetical protein
MEFSGIPLSPNPPTQRVSPSLMSLIAYIDNIYVMGEYFLGIGYYL